MASPVLTLNSPADGSTQNPASTVLIFTGTDAESNGILYNVQVDTSNSFNSNGGNPLFDLLSSNDNGFYEGSDINFTDPFKANALDTTKWTLTTGGGATVSYGSSGMSMVFPGSSTASTLARIASVGRINLTNQAVYFPTSSRFANATDASAFMWLYVDTNNWIRVGWEAGVIYAQSKYNGSLVKNQPLSDAPYTYKVFRIRTSGSTLYWEASANGESFTSITSMTFSIDVTALQVIYEALCNKNETNPGTFTFSNFNIPLTHAAGNSVNLKGLSLDGGETYYWRVRGKDPNGSNTYGSWSSVNSFVTDGDGAAYKLRIKIAGVWQDVSIHYFNPD